MKKLIVSVFSVFLILTLVGCGKTAKSSDSSDSSSSGGEGIGATVVFRIPKAFIDGRTFGGNTSFPKLTLSATPPLETPAQYTITAGEQGTEIIYEYSVASYSQIKIDYTPLAGEASLEYKLAYSVVSAKDRNTNYGLGVYNSQNTYALGNGVVSCIINMNNNYAINSFWKNS